MKLTRGTQRLHSSPPCVATIGNFDGLHQGHRKIINQVNRLSRQHKLQTTVISFEPLPTEYFSQKFAQDLPGRIYPYRDKARLLNGLGVDEFVCLKFSQAFSEMPAETFITDILHRRLNVKHLIVGDDFRFGKQRRGDFQMLEEIGGQLGIEVANIPTVQQKGARISSTRIREHLQKGELEAANTLLGERYQLSGRIRHGDKRGRTLGFATLNLSLPEDIVVARGVYAVKIHGLSRHVLNGVANIGKRPTVAGLETRLETHVFDFDEQVYGKLVCIELLRYLRAEKKFAGIEALIAQINHDSKDAKIALGISTSSLY